jgi:hypothetical protein
VQQQDVQEFVRLGTIPATVQNVSTVFDMRELQNFARLRSTCPRASESGYISFLQEASKDFGEKVRAIPLVLYFMQLHMLLKLDSQRVYFQCVGYSHPAVRLGSGIARVHVLETR